MRATISSKALLALNLSGLPETVRSINRMATRGKWTYRLEKETGGSPRKEFLIRLLPKEIRDAINTHDILKRAGSKTMTLNKDENLLPAQSKIALAKVDLVKHYAKHVASAPWGKKDQARADFINLYEQLQTWPMLYKVLGTLSWKTIERWKTQLASGADPVTLVDKRGYSRKGSSTLTAEQTGIVLTCALQPNAPKLSYAIRMAKKIMDRRGIANGHAEATYRRYIHRWKERNKDQWVFFRHGEKALEDDVAYDLVRDYSKIEVGDVIVADGHVLNFETINPWTGKPKRMALILWIDMKSTMPLGWVIMPGENTQAISAALMYAIITLGKYPKVAYMDNGKAFRAKFFNGTSLDECGLQGLYARLGIETLFAWPYHGKSKTIERFFGTMHEMESFMPTYVGNCIENKPPRMHRGEKLHVALWDKVMQGRSLSMEETYHVVASWFDEYAVQPKRGQLKGKTPLQVFEQGRGPGVDSLELRILMMEEKVKTIRKNGIRLFNTDYYHPALYGRAHSAYIKYDLQNPSSILVYDDNGSFLCEASPKQAVHPAARILGTDADKALLKSEIELKQSLKKQTIGPARELLQNNILPAYKKQIEAIGLAQIPGGQSGRQPIQQKKELSEAETTRIETEYQQRLREQEVALPCPEETAEEYVSTVEDPAIALWREVEQLGDMQRYEKLLELTVTNTLIPKKWQAYMQYYELTEEYRRHGEYWDDFRAKMALLHQMSGT